MLLTATALGLTASFLSQPIEVAEQRRRLRQLLADQMHPQAILRMGFSPPATTTTPGAMPQTFSSHRPRQVDRERGCGWNFAAQEEGLSSERPWLH